MSRESGEKGGWEEPKLAKNNGYTMSSSPKLDILVKLRSLEQN